MMPVRCKKSNILKFIVFEPCYLVRRAITEYYLVIQMKIKFNILHLVVFCFADIVDKNLVLLYIYCTVTCRCIAL